MHCHHIYIIFFYKAEFYFLNSIYQFPMFLNPISKLFFNINSQPVVIPAEAGIHVFQGLKWTSDFSGVTDSSGSYYLEMSSEKKLYEAATGGCFKHICP